MNGYMNAFYFELKVQKTYNHLRSHNILILPSSETLNRYIKIVKGWYDFQSSTFEILKKKNVESNNVLGIHTIFDLQKSILLTCNAIFTYYEHKT